MTTAPCFVRNGPCKNSDTGAGIGVAMKKKAYSLFAVFLSLSSFFAVGAPISEPERKLFESALSKLFEHPEIRGVEVPGKAHFKQRLDNAESTAAANVVLAAAENSLAIQKRVSPGGFQTIKDAILRSLDISVPQITSPEQEAFYTRLFNEFYTVGHESHFMQSEVFKALGMPAPGLNSFQLAALNHFLNDYGSYGTRPGEGDSYSKVKLFPKLFVPTLEMLKKIDTREKLDLFKRFDTGADFRFNIRANFRRYKYISSLIDLIVAHPEPEKIAAVLAIGDLLEIENARNSRGGSMARNPSTEASDDVNGADLVKFLSDEISKIVPLAEAPGLRYEAFSVLLRGALGHQGVYYTPQGVWRKLDDGSFFVTGSIDSNEENFDVNGDAILEHDKLSHFDSLKAVRTLFPFVNKVMTPTDIDVFEELTLRVANGYNGPQVEVHPIWGKEIGKPHTLASLADLIGTAKGPQARRDYIKRKGGETSKARSAWKSFCEFLATGEWP